MQLAIVLALAVAPIAQTAGEAAPDAPPAAPAPDAKPAEDPGVLLPIGQVCVGTACAWLPIPFVTSSIAGYVVTYLGNSFGTKDSAASSPILAGVITDVAVIAVIAGGYGLMFVAIGSGNDAAAITGLLGGLVLVTGAFFVRPLAIGIATTATWSLGADPRTPGAKPNVPPPFFSDADAE